MPMRHGPAHQPEREPSALLETWRVLGATSCIPGTVRMCPGAGQFAGIDNQILVADRAAFEPAFEDLARARSISRLCRQRRARSVRRHAVMWHGPPGMVLRWRLREP